MILQFNLMSYDFHGAWDKVTGVDAPLYYQGFGNEEFNIHRCVENYVALGVPRDRISKYTVSVGFVYSWFTLLLCW